MGVLQVDVADASHDLGLDDDSIFAVPDIDLPGFATDDVAPKVALGKQLISDDFDVRASPCCIDRFSISCSSSNERTRQVALEHRWKSLEKHFTPARLFVTLNSPWLARLCMEYLIEPFSCTWA
jgi:hypothetical protein